MNGLLGNIRRAMPPTESLAGARGAFDALPGIMDAVGRLPEVLHALPPAPVILGAASRMLSDAIAKELAHRGPSPGFIAACAAAGVDEAAAALLHTELVAEITR